MNKETWKENEKNGRYAGTNEKCCRTAYKIYTIYKQNTNKPLL